MNSFPISLFSDGRVVGIPCSLGLMVSLSKFVLRRCIPYHEKTHSDIPENIQRMRV